MARGWVMPGETVIDAACATGYGSHLIGQYAGKVIGLDIDEGCIAEGYHRWGAPNLEFKQFDLSKDELPDADTLISIETCEHINDLDHFIDQTWKHIRRCIVICSPIGGTSWDYTPEQLKTPAGENNDFITEGDLARPFVQRGWVEEWHNSIGYSSMFIFFKVPPTVPEGYTEGAFKIEN